VIDRAESLECDYSPTVLSDNGSDKDTDSEATGRHAQPPMAKMEPSPSNWPVSLAKETTWVLNRHIEKRKVGTGTKLCNNPPDVRYATDNLMRISTYQPMALKSCEGLTIFEEY
jgi:hypothetical protein